MNEWRYASILPTRLHIVDNDNFTVTRTTRQATQLRVPEDFNNTAVTTILELSSSAVAVFVTVVF